MSFWEELKRRNVVKVAVAYAIVAWVLVQVADTFFPALQLPEWTVTFVAALLILGFPAALVLSWAYELTPDGLKRNEAAVGAESGQGYTFEGFHLDAQRRLLFRAGGEPIPLAPKVFDTLLYFVERPGQLLDKRELIEAIWPNVIVEENNLNQAISALRRVLGEAPGQHRFIVTEPGRGYRFVATVHIETQSPVPANGRRDSAPGSVHSSSRRLGYVGVLAAMVAAGVLVADRYVLRDSGPAAIPASIAVLPFENRSAAEENAAFLADGIHADLLTQLSRISAFEKVISSTSVQEFREGPRNLREIGRALDVTSILEGSVQRTGDQVHINVQLIDAETDGHLWAGDYDRELTAENIFGIQSEIARSIATALHATLTPREAERLGELPTESTLAYEFYLRGLDYEEQGQERFLESIYQYERAVEVDPNFALAHARLGMINVRAFSNGVDPNPTRLEDGRRAAENAIDIERDLPEAYLTLAYYHFVSGRMNEALTELLIAAPDAQGDDQFFIIRGSVNHALGRWERILEDQLRALELNPRDVTVVMGTVETYRQIRDYESADRHCKGIADLRPEFAFRALACSAETALMRDGDVAAVEALPPPPRPEDDFRTRPLRAHAALYDRDYETAARLAALPEDEQLLIPGQGLFLARVRQLSGNEGYARRIYDRVLEVTDGRPSGSSRIGRRNAFFRIRAIAGLGRYDEAVPLAQQTLADTKDKGLANLMRLNLILDVFIPSGQHEIALRELDTYLSEPGQWSIESLSHDPRLDPIRHDADFLVLVEKHKRK